jgi:hypothetical protein
MSINYLECLLGSYSSLTLYFVFCFSFGFLVFFFFLFLSSFWCPKHFTVFFFGMSTSFPLVSFPSLGLLATTALAAYSTSTVTYSVTTPSVGAGWTLVSLSDDDYSTVSIGFTFTFNSNSYTTASISSNGVVYFTNPTTTSYNSLPFSFTTNAVALWSQDLYPSNNIYYRTTGVAGSRIFFVAYSSVSQYSGSGTVSVQLKLFETTNALEIHYISTPTNVQAASGVQFGTQATAIVNSQPSASLGGTAYAFTNGCGLTCINGGTCVILDGGFSYCACTSSYSGPTCSTFGSTGTFSACT